MFSLAFVLSYLMYRTLNLLLGTLPCFHHNALWHNLAYIPIHDFMGFKLKGKLNLD